MLCSRVGLAVAINRRVRAIILFGNPRLFSHAYDVISIPAAAAVIITAAPVPGGVFAIRDPLQYLRPPFVYSSGWTRPVSVVAMTEQDRQISKLVAEQRSRLSNFIRRRVPNPADAEDIVQEVFYELVEANRLLMPIEHVTGWLFRVARNRITDLFRKKKPVPFADAAVEDESGEILQIEDLLPSPDAGPEALYFRSVLLDELEIALAELPGEQREVFVAHELDGRSFKELSGESSVSVNTLLSRKRYAVLHLRERLQSIYDELGKR
jgi:RNA polymerase sigma factor (sigma-70 family)